MAPETDPPTKRFDADSAPDVNVTAPAVGNLIGKTLGGRYLIEEEIGRGGMGAVYIARDKPALMSRRVVVKVLLEDSLKDEWILQKFQQEIESLTRLDDPGIVGIVDAGTLDDGAPYLVMQFVDGVNLRTELRSGGMELERAANIIRQLGNTLGAAHDAGIIHRDLKPENIMLRRATSGQDQVKVIDFGIAKVKNSVIAPSTVTGAGTAGTIGYMSPEQLGAQRITPASDVYALGIIAYEMLTGIRPFNPETAFQLRELQRDGVQVGPKALRPALSDAAQVMILKALEFEPARRFQRAREFSEALAAALTDPSHKWEASTMELPITEEGPSRSGPVSKSEPSPAPSRAPTISSQRPAMELAHVLFMDIVGYSKLTNDLQANQLRKLQKIVRATAEFVRAEADDQLMRLPTGDGMALVFFNDPEAPVHCAIEVSKALKDQPDLQLRMGVHSGPVNQIVDVNESANVAGAGINVAQRVMDCGDAGHILLSKRMADDLSQYSEWQPHLHDLGETEVKHGVRMHVFNLYSDEYGNSEFPEKFKKKRRTPIPFGVIAAVAAVLVLGLAVGLALWHPWNRPAPAPNTNVIVGPAARRGFTYYLTPSENGKSVESEHLTGIAPFRSGDKFVFVFIPEQKGSFYFLNRGSDANQKVSWFVLFPTPKKSNSIALVEANQRVEVDLYFGQNTGEEKFCIIWSAQSHPKLDEIFKAAAQNGFKITDPAAVTFVNDLIAQNETPAPEVDLDNTKLQTTIRSASDIVIYKFALRHRSLQ